MGKSEFLKTCFSYNMISVGIFKFQNTVKHILMLSPLIGTDVALILVFQCKQVEEGDTTYGNEIH